MSEAQPAGGDETPKKKGLGDTALRVVSAVPLVALILWLLFWAPSWGFHVFAVIAVAIVGRELMRMAMPGRTGLIVLGTLSCVALACTIIFAAQYVYPVLLGIGFAALVAALAAPDPIETAGARIAWLLGGPIYVSLLVPVDLLRAMPRGGEWVVLSMMLAFLSDTFAYFAGRAFGKHKLYPKLSPKKTIEGSVGGLAGATGGALAAVFLMGLPIPVVDAVLLGVVGGAAGQAGDLLESLLKRSAGVKDSGQIMPGHGGLLDRTDALMFTASITWLYATYVLPLRG